MTAPRSQTVLVVEDEEDLREGLCELLEQDLGMNVIGVPSAESALEHLQKASVALIVSDFKMKGMDGAAFLEEAGRVAPGTPCVLISAYLDAEARAQARGLNVPFVHKPLLDFDEFCALLRRAMR
jgi:DNA-binding NtrC family response regulator